MKKQQGKLMEGPYTSQQKNKELKEKLVKRNSNSMDNLIDFNEVTKEKEQKFQREFKHEMNELGTASEDLIKDNED